MQRQRSPSSPSLTPSLSLAFIRGSEIIRRTSRRPPESSLSIANRILSALPRFAPPPPPPLSLSLSVSRRLPLPCSTFLASSVSRCQPNFLIHEKWGIDLEGARNGTLHARASMTAFRAPTYSTIAQPFPSPTTASLFPRLFTSRAVLHKGLRDRSAEPSRISLGVYVRARARE